MALGEAPRQSGGRGSEGNMDESLYCGFLGNEWARQGKQSG